MFHIKGIRNSYQYYLTFQNTFPNVRAVVELPSGIFSACFDIFVDAIGEYQEYRKKLAEKAEKRKIGLTKEEKIEL